MLNLTQFKGELVNYIAIKMALVIVMNDKLANRKTSKKFLTILVQTADDIVAVHMSIVEAMMHTGLYTCVRCMYLRGSKKTFLARIPLF